jgi:hypothetical protein
LKSSIKQPLTLLLALVLSGISRAAFAQTSQPSTDQSTAPANVTNNADKTGTNPLNLQRTFQIANEFDALGHAQINYMRFRYTEAFDSGKMSLRVEAPLVYAHAAFAAPSSDGSDDGGDAPVTQDVDESRFGLGDITLKYSYVPYVSAKGGLLSSLEFSGPSATNDVLGAGKWVLAPTIVYGIFLPGSTIFAPAYKQSVGFGGDGNRANINSGTLDFYLVKKFDRGRQWVTIDPTYLLNYQSGKYSGGTLRIQYGRLLGKVGNAVMSGYIKPGIGIGQDRPSDWSCEIGITLIGF